MPVSRRRTRYALALVALLILQATSAVGGAQAASARSAAAFHQYSTITSPFITPVRALSTKRYDQMQSPVAGGCTAPYTGNPMFQTQWIRKSNDIGRWLEIGTGHQCFGNYRYWFFGYGSGGTYYSVAYQSGITNGQKHEFRIQASGTTWNYYVDVTLFAAYVTSTAFDYMQTGLESYALGAGEPGYGISDPRYISLNGSWANWPSYTTRIDSSMCGSAVSFSFYVAGQNGGGGLC